MPLCQDCKPLLHCCVTSCYKQMQDYTFLEQSQLFSLQHSFRLIICGTLWNKTHKYCTVCGLLQSLQCLKIKWDCLQAQWIWARKNSSIGNGIKFLFIKCSIVTVQRLVFINKWLLKAKASTHDNCNDSKKNFYLRLEICYSEQNLFNYYAVKNIYELPSVLQDFQINKSRTLYPL